MRYTTSFMLPGIMLLTPLVSAQPGATLDFSGSAELGSEYNSNITVSELESAANTSDSAVLFNGELNLEWQPRERLIAEGGYSYRASRFQDADVYDLELHLLHADISYEFPALTLGTNYYYADADLGGDAFLALKQYSFYAGKLLGESWYLRGALDYADKDFAQFLERNADDDGASLDVFYFFNEGNSTLNVGYERVEEAAFGSEFSYSANTLQVSFTQRFRMLNRDARGQAGLRWQDRDYDNVTASIGSKRNDTQRLLDAELEFDFTQHFALVARLESGHYESNLPSADFTDRRASLSVKASF